MSSEIWYQSIEDLLAALETSRGDGADERSDDMAQTVSQPLPVTPRPFNEKDACAQPPHPAAPASATGNPSTGPAVAGAASTPALKSAADAELLLFLGAKIRALGDPPRATQRPAPQRRGEAATVAVSAAGTVAPTPPMEPAPPPAGPDIAAGYGQGGRTPEALPPIESTQTLRPLTPLELTESVVSRWFAIQLKVSADPIDAAEVPNLDILEEYKLYSVTDSQQGRRSHALRLGFFSSAVAAEAVVRYLTAYFPTSTITRVSIAERERFADKLVTPGKDVGASGKRAVIELVGVPAQAPETGAAEVYTTAAEIGREGKKPPARPEKQLWSWLRRRG